MEKSPTPSSIFHTHVVRGHPVLHHGASHPLGHPSPVPPLTNPFFPHPLTHGHHPSVLHSFSRLSSSLTGGHSDPFFPSTSPRLKGGFHALEAFSAELSLRSSTSGPLYANGSSSPSMHHMLHPGSPFLSKSRPFNQSSSSPLPSSSSTTSTSSAISSSQSNRTGKSKICGVCGDRAKSYHFGGISCDSCKAFFRRSVQNDAYKNFHCPYEGQCDINITSRKCCQFCRFKKCLSIGMEKSWVMTEEERLQMLKSRLEKRQKQDGDPHDKGSGSSTGSGSVNGGHGVHGIHGIGSPPDTMTIKELDGHCDRRFMSGKGTLFYPINRHKLRRLRRHYRPDLERIHDHITEQDIRTIEGIINDYILSCREIPVNEELITRFCYPNDTDEDEHDFDEDEDEDSDEDDDFDDHQSSDGHDGSRGHKRISRGRRSEEEEDEFVDVGTEGDLVHPVTQVSQMNQSIHSVKNVISKGGKENLNPAHLNERKRNQISNILHLLFTAVQQLSSFSSKLSIFTKISPADQEVLLRGSVLELCFIRSGFAFDRRKNRWSRSNVVSVMSGKVMIPTVESRIKYKKIKTQNEDDKSSVSSSSPSSASPGNDNVLRSDDLKEFLHYDLFKKHMNFVRSICDLGVDEVTIILLSVIVLLNPDRHGLKEPQVVSEQQDKLVIILQNYMAWKFGSIAASIMFGKLFLKLPDLKELADTLSDYQLTLPPEEMDKLHSQLHSLTLTSPSLSSSPPSSSSSSSHSSSSSSSHVSTSSSIPSSMSSPTESTTSSSSLFASSPDHLVTPWSFRRDVLPMSQQHQQPSLHRVAQVSPSSSSYGRIRSRDLEDDISSSYSSPPSVTYEGSNPPDSPVT